MKNRRWLFLGAAGAGALLLAFLLRSTVQEWVILPLAKLIWRLGILYRGIPQVVYWVILLVIITSLTIGIFFSAKLEWGSAVGGSHFRSGDIQQMAFWLRRSRRGILSRWHVANQLANIALDILARQTGSTKHDQRLEGPGWDAPKEVQDYLKAALTTTYADYPSQGLFSGAPPTPFDHDPEPIVAYLESLLEDNHDHQHS